MDNFFTRLRDKLKDWWQSTVIEPRRKAAIKREKVIVDAPKTKERSLMKLSAIVETKPEVDYDEIVKRAAERYRKLVAEQTGKTEQAKANELRRLVEYYQATPKPVKSAVETVAGTRETGLQKLMKALDWVATRVWERIPLAMTAYRDVMQPAMKSLQEQKPFTANRFVTPHVTKLPEDEAKFLREKRREALRAAWQTFLHPAEYKEKHGSPLVVRPEDLPERWPGWAKNLTSFAVEMFIEEGVDPTNWIGVVTKPLRTLSRTAKVSKASEAAKTAKQVSNIAEAIQAQKRIDRLTEAVRTLNRQREQYKTMLETTEPVIKDLERKAKRAGKFIDKVSEVRLTEINKKLAKALTDIPKSDAAITKRLERVTKLMQQRDSHMKRVRDALNVLDTFEKEQRKFTGLQKRLSTIDNRLKQLYSALDKIERGSEYVLKAGPATVRLRRLGDIAGDVYRKTVTSVSPLRRLVNRLVETFRTTTPRYMPEISPQEARRLADNMQLLAQRLRSATSVPKATAFESVERWLAENIPERVAELASIGHEKAGLGKYTSFMKKVIKDEGVETARAVNEAIKLYRTLDAENIRMLERAFGPQMIEYFGKSVGDIDEGWKFFLRGYVTHIVTDPPEKVYNVLKNHWRKMVRAVPGTTPSMVKRRIVPSIEVLEELGLHPIKDIRVLDAAHKYQVQRLIMLKDTTDWLTAKGFILPKKVREAADWADASNLFPWLRGKAMHPEIARVFKDLMPVIEMQSDTLKALLKPLGKVNSIFKTLVTVPRLAFHQINLLGNLVLGKLAGIPASEMAYRMGRAVKILLDPSGDEKQLARLVRHYGLTGQGVFADLVTAPKKIAIEVSQHLNKLTGGRIGAIKGIVFPKYESKLAAPIHLGRWLGEVVDTLARTAAFTHFIDKGYTPVEAAKLVKRYFFDYGQLTAIEKQGFRNIVPFYAWVRNAIPRAILGTVEHPTALGTVLRLRNISSTLAGVDPKTLPSWLQDAVILGTDEEGRYIYSRIGSPYEPLTQFFGEVPEKGVPALLRAVAGTVTPLYTAGNILFTGVDPTTGERIPEDITEENVGLKRLGEALRRLSPTWEIEQSLAVPYRGDRPRVTTSLLPGLLGMLIPIKKYDYPYVQARDVARAENVIDAYKARIAEELGTDIPDTQSIKAEVGKLDKSAKLIQIIKDLRTDRIKLFLLYALSGGQFSSMWNMLQQNPDLFIGSSKDVVEKMRILFTKENYETLRNYLGRVPTARDFVMYADRLMLGEVPQTTPTERRLERILSDVKYMKRAEETGGLKAVPTLSVEDIDSMLYSAVDLTKVQQSWLPYLRWLAWHTSKFDPRTQGIASSGERTVGLFQLPEGVFRQYAAQGMNDALNPYHNTVAAIRYIKDRYKHPKNIPGIGDPDTFKGY